MTIHARRALLDDTWVENLRVEIAGGLITALEPNARARIGDTRVDTLLPALGNLHSHAFQRAMAGMTEHRSAGRDSFWTWRALMYRFLDHLTPDHVTAIAALAYMEMLEAGYAAVGEFHYVHHQPGGTPYDNLAELSTRIFTAASETGIGLTHLPVLYTYGGVAHQPLTGGQLRFANTPDRFLTLVETCRSAARALPADTRIGIAPHSLRATTETDLAQVLAATPHGPVHIHIAEQQQEVRDVETALGQRPVAWLLDHFDVSNRWCLIHATHMTPSETTDLAHSGAVAGLCPITEANLGDGAFNGPDYLAANGAFGIGTDSNIRIALSEELRMLEYSQRLRDMARNVLAPATGSTGHRLYTAAARGGAQALDRTAGVIATGHLADLVAIDSTAPVLCALADRQLLDGLVFASGRDAITDTWSAGRHMVQHGRHIARDTILARYRTTLADLTAQL